MEAWSTLYHFNLNINSHLRKDPYNHVWLTGDEQTLTPAAQGKVASMLEIVSKTGEGHGGMDMGGMNDSNENQEKQSDMSKKEWREESPL